MNLLKTTFSFFMLFTTIMEASAQNNSLAEVSGVYSGNIPCTDCRGIQYRISLQRDGTYEESALYEGRSEAPDVSNGNYTVLENSILKLNGKSIGKGLFRIMPSALLMLDEKGNEFTGSLSNRYILSKLTRSVKNSPDEGEKIITAPLNRKKFSHGITFYATGNEPSWSLDISEEKSIKFTDSEGLTLNTPFVKGVKAMDANVTIYTSETEAGMLRIQIRQEACDDNMSGKMQDYKVTVDVKNSGDTESSHFEGCGTYVPDFNIEGKWTLKKMGIDEVNPESYMHELPYFEINLDSFRYTGYTGCNRMMGKVSKAEMGMIRFEEGGITMMACQNMDKEAAFLDALRKTTQYKLADDQLILSNPDKTTLVMSKHTESLPKGYRLVDIWVLESMNAVNTDPKDYRNDLPRLEINSEMKFTGTTGCNNISGTLEADDKTIKMKIEKMTRMACTNSSAETAFVDALNNATTYSISSNRLHLSQDGKTSLIFRKVD